MRSLCCVYVNLLQGQHTHEAYTGDRTKEAFEQFADSLVPSAGQPQLKHAQLKAAPKASGCNVAGAQAHDTCGVGASKFGDRVAAHLGGGGQVAALCSHSLSGGAMGSSKNASQQLSKGRPEALEAAQQGQPAGQPCFLSAAAFYLLGPLSMHTAGKMHCTGFGCFLQGC